MTELDPTPPAAPAEDALTITAEHIRELHEAHQQREPSPIGHTDNMQPVLAVWHGAVEVMIETTALVHGLHILYTSEQLDSWLDGTDMGPGDADTIAAEVNAEIRQNG